MEFSKEAIVTLSAPRKLSGLLVLHEWLGREPSVQSETAGLPVIPPEL